MQASSALFRVVLSVITMPLLSPVLVLGADTAKVTVDAIVVEPAAPAPSTLCKLKVRVKNGDAQTISFLKFSVKIDAKDLSVYKMQSYAINIEPGTIGEIDLYNFWTPSEAKTFEIQVTLAEAQLVQVKKEGTTTTTTPSGPVAGLPASATLSVKMSPGK
jgi:hypothetical protein